MKKRLIVILLLLTSTTLSGQPPLSKTYVDGWLQHNYPDVAMDRRILYILDGIPVWDDTLNARPAKYKCTDLSFIKFLSRTELEKSTSCKPLEGIVIMATNGNKPVNRISFDAVFSTPPKSEIYLIVDTLSIKADTTTIRKLKPDWIKQAVYVDLGIINVFAKKKYQKEVMEVVKRAGPTIGIGRMQVSLNHHIPLYHDETASVPFDTIRFSVVESGEEKGKFQVVTKRVANFKPMSYYAGDSDEEGMQHTGMGLVYFAPDLAFRVVKQTASGYEIVIDEKTFETAIIKNDSTHKLYTVGKPYWGMSHNSGRTDEVWFLYETWEAYLKRMYSISVNKGQGVYDKIDGKENPNAHRRSGIALEVEGYWVKLGDRPNGYNTKSSEEAWAKWTDGKKFLVHLTSEIYY